MRPRSAAARICPSARVLGEINDVDVLLIAVVLEQDLPIHERGISTCDDATGRIAQLELQLGFGKAVASQRLQQQRSISDSVGRAWAAANWRAVRSFTTPGRPRRAR